MVRFTEIVRSSQMLYTLTELINKKIKSLEDDGWEVVDWKIENNKAYLVSRK